MLGGWGGFGKARKGVKRVRDRNVNPRRGFVEEEEGRLSDERQTDAELTTVAATQALRPRVAVAEHTTTNTMCVHRASVCVCLSVVCATSES